MPLLDLSGADTRGFDPIPSGTYDSVVYEAKMDEVKNASGEGSLPAGTPMIKVQFKITGGPGGVIPADPTVAGSKDKPYPAGNGEDYEFYNRRVFRNYFIPPAKGYDAGKAAKMKGMLVRFLEALGYDKETTQSADFDLDLNDLNGRECRVIVAQRNWTNPETDEVEVQNDVKGIKAPGVPAAGGLV